MVGLGMSTPPQSAPTRVAALSNLTKNRAPTPAWLATVMSENSELVTEVFESLSETSDKSVHAARTAVFAAFVHHGGLGVAVEQLSRPSGAVKRPQRFPM